MKISGFTIIRNAVKYNYPVSESIRSVLPVCDEFVVNIGDCEDGTADLIAGIKSDKIRIIQNTWDMSQKSEMLSHQTNLALAACTGDWAFYLQSDEVIHEDDRDKLRNTMRRYKDDSQVDALRFQWLHFYGSYFRYRIDSGWYQKQDRIIRNNGQIESFGDAFGFRRKDGQPLRRKNTGCFVYHYGWVQPQDVMAQRRANAEAIGFVALNGDAGREEYFYGDLNRFPVYFGTHPNVMGQKIHAHPLSQQDWQNIKQKYWWFPARWFRVRYKTGRRVKEKIV